jgi:hypothetical protein
LRSITNTKTNNQIKTRQLIKKKQIMQEKHKNEIAKIINDFKPVNYTWYGFLALLAVTEGYALPVIISNIWAKKISRKHQVESEEVETITENVKVGEKIDPKILELLNKLEECAKSIKNKSDTAESDKSAFITLRRGAGGATRMDENRYYQELQQRDNRNQISQGAIALELQEFSVLVKKLYKAITSLPPESQNNINLNLLEKIKTVAESEPDKLNKQLEILRRSLPSIINSSSFGDKDITIPKTEVVKKLVQVPDHPKLESTRKSKFAAAAMSAIAILVAYNPYFDRMNIAEPYNLALFNQAIKSGDPIAVDINEKIRLPTYKVIESGAIKASQVLAQIPGKFPLLPNPSANEGYDANQKKAPLTGDPREQSNSPIHNIIGQEAYQKYLQQNPENAYIPDSSVSILNRNTNNLEFIDQKDLNVNLLNKEETMSIMRPSPFDMGIIKHNEERGIDPIDIKLDTQSNRVFFKIQTYNADKNTKVFFDKYFLHPKLISLGSRLGN